MIALAHAFPEGFDLESYAIEPVSGVDPLEPGAEIPVGNRTLETVPIPGHSSGPLAILDRSAGICHGADVLEPAGNLRSLRGFDVVDALDIAAGEDLVVFIDPEAGYGWRR
ncbi:MULTISPECIES: hypothetical protein [Halorussus]|uniref:hypothetical protein n=1 Tax=Halorussus TaxID=1070314 RepID=UPI0013B37B50|nr:MULTISPECIES: hypothetical protein [Halorussus]NHN60033.1 hypothetical protein [Halorussus sp. JP-T4]